MVRICSDWASFFFFFFYIPFCFFLRTVARTFLTHAATWHVVINLFIAHSFYVLVLFYFICKITRIYTGDQTSSIAVAMAKCDPLGPLMINVVKLYSTPDGEAFTALGRVYSGAVRTGQKVKVRVFSFAMPRV